MDENDMDMAELKNHRGIIGSLIGDMSGSSREFRTMKSRGFKLFDSKSSFTDDSVLTMAVAEWMLDREHVSLEQTLLKWGRDYPNAGFGRGFKAFLKSGRRNPVGSTHNGSAMRVSPVGYLSGSLEECMELAKESALPSHDTREGVVGAQATAAAIFMARNGSSKEEIRRFVEERFGFDLSLTFAQARERQMLRMERRESADHEVRSTANEQLLACDLTVTDALIVFLESDSYEETVRNAIYLGGDSDTLACIAGGIAAAYWGVPQDICEYAVSQLPSDIIDVINRVDGSSWRPGGITPKNTKKWKRTDYVVYGTNQAGDDGEDGFADVRPGRFNRHPNTGYPIFTIGNSLEGIAKEVDRLLQDAKANPSCRYLVREIGISKAGFSVDRIAPLFRPALEIGNILLPASFVRALSV